MRIPNQMWEADFFFSLRARSAAREISDCQGNLFVSAGFSVALAVRHQILGCSVEMHAERTSANIVLHRLNLATYCAHAFPSWMDTVLYSIFSTLSHLPLLLTPSPPSTPFSIQCEIIVTTTTQLHRPQRITTQPTFLLYLLPKILHQTLAPQKTMRRQSAGGLKVKSHFSSTMLKQIVF